MYFGTKSYLKSNHYHTFKNPLTFLEGSCLWGAFSLAFFFFSLSAADETLFFDYLSTPLWTCIFSSCLFQLLMLRFS